MTATSPADGQVQLCVLGTVTAKVGGLPVTPGGPGARAVLARLVAAAKSARAPMRRLPQPLALLVVPLP